MTTLTIYTDTMTAIEVINGDNVKYVESFNTWQELFNTLEKYFDYYAWIEIKSKSPKVGLFSHSQLGVD